MIRCYCGLPGSGKTSLLTKLAIAKMKKGYSVYSNYPISFKFKGVMLSTYVLTKDMLKNPSFPQNSVLVIDEVQNWFNSRYFKDFSKDNLKFFTGHRHLGVDMYVGVQHPARVDTAIREIVDTYIWIKPLPLFNRFKVLTEYYHFDDVNRTDISEELYRRSFTTVSKKTLTCFDTCYLKDTFDMEIVESDEYQTFKGKYRNIFKRFYDKYMLRKQFLDGVKLKKQDFSRRFQRNGIKGYLNNIPCVIKRYIEVIKKKIPSYKV